MAPDGKTFYSASPGTRTLVAVDITQPVAAGAAWVGPYDSHGLSISDDGNRAYVAGIGSGLIILDTSEIQARKPNPKVREIARLQWDAMSIPQNAIPVTIDDHPYLVEIDEFGTLDKVGAGRIIDIGDETQPKVISNMRLGVHQPENFDEIGNDPQASLGLQGYAGHYCNVPQRDDPGIVACSMILSGPAGVRHPRSVPPEGDRLLQRADQGPRRSSRRATGRCRARRSLPERGEIWYSDGFQGFYNVRSRTTSGRSSAAPGRRRRSPPSSRRRRGRGRRRDPRALAGKDRIKAGAERDRICGRGGNDRIAGGPGRDRIDCGKGRDVATPVGCDRIRRCGPASSAAASSKSPQRSRGPLRRTGSQFRPARTPGAEGEDVARVDSGPTAHARSRRRGRGATLFSAKYSCGLGRRAAGQRRSPTGIVRNQAAIASVVLMNASGIESPKKTTGVSEDVRDPGVDRSGIALARRPWRCAWRSRTTSSPLTTATETA